MLKIDQERLKYYRIPLIIIAVIYLIIGILFRTLDKYLFDPWYLRASIEVLITSLIIGTYKSKYVINKFYLFFNLLLYIITLWTIFITFINDLIFSYAIIFIATITVVSFALRQAEKIIYYAVFITATTFFFIIYKNIEVLNAISILVSVIFIQLVAYVVIKTKNISKDKLTENEKTLKEAQSISKMGSWEYSIDNDKLIWSQEIFNIFELNIENKKLSYYDFIDNIHPDDKLIADIRLRDFSENNNSFDLEYRIITKYFKIKYVREKSTVVFDKQKKETKFIGIIQDITTHKIALFQIEESNTRFKEIIQQINDGIIVFDQNKKITIWNKGAEEIFEKEQEKIINENIASVLEEFFYTKNDFENLMLKIKNRAYQSINNSNTFDYEIVTSSNTKKYIEIKIFPIEFNKYKLFCMIVRDSGERRNYEKQLRELNDGKDKMISVLAHDLKNPFNIILGFSDLILNNFDDLDREKIFKHVNIINQSTRTTYTLLEDLLLWAKSQSGKINFEPGKIEFTNLILKIIFEQSISAKTKNIEISYHENEKIFVNSDLQMTNTILRNLISNAVKYTVANGKIEISTTTENNTLTVCIADDGIGMTKETLNSLWKTNKILSQEGTAGEKGSGFGLVLCNDFVEKNKGKIWAESQINKGSKFFFTLPLFSE